MTTDKRGTTMIPLHTFKHRRNTPRDWSTASCQCRFINGPNSHACPTHHPKAYATMSARHKRVDLP